MTISEITNLAIAIFTGATSLIALITVIVTTKQNKKINDSIMKQNEVINNSIMKQNEKINTSELISGFYFSIFNDYLVKQIPLCRREIRFEKGKIKNIGKLNDVLNKMLGDSTFFKYENNDFYKELKAKIESTQEYLKECGNRNDIIDDSDETEIKEKINEHLSSIYVVITNSMTYIGKL